MTLQLAAQRHGPADGPLIVWLHGFLGDRDDWASLVAQLPDFRHLCVDLPGHGASPPLADDSAAFEAVGDALLACIARHEVQAQGRGLTVGVTVVGYSLGARVAMALAPALHTRGQLACAVFVSGHPGLSDPALRRARLDIDQGRAAELRAAGLPAFVTRWYDAPLLRTLDRAPAAPLLRARRANGDPDARARTLVALSTGQQPDRRPALVALASRLVWIAGQDDAKYTALLREAHGATPGSTLVVVPGAGHHVHLEQPGAFLRALVAALPDSRAS